MQERSLFDTHIVLDAVACGVIIQDGAGRVSFANSAAQRIIGLTLSELQALRNSAPIWQLQREDGTPLTQEEAPAGRARATGQAQQGVLAMVYRDGARHLVAITAVPITESDLRVEQVVVTFTDITEQRAAEAALRASEAQFRTFIEHLPVGAGLVAPDGELLFQNATARDLLGIDPERLQGRSVRDGSWSAVAEDGRILSAEDTPVGRALASRRPVRQRVVGLMHAVRTEPLWVEMSAIPQIAAHGQLTGIIVVLVDITARIQSEATNALYAELMRQLPIGFTAWHADDVHDAHSLRLIATNAATSRYAGRSLDAMIGRTVDECFPGALQADTGQTYLRVLRTQQPVHVGDFPYEGPAGAPAFYSVLMFPLPNHAVGVLSEDITDRKRAVEAAEYLSAIVESSLDAIIGKTLEGIITSWNRGAQRIYGYSAAEAIGQPITMLVPPDRPDEIPMILQRLRAGDRVEHFETRRVRRDGQEITVSVSVSPILNAAGQIGGASTIARDITVQKQAEQRITRQLEQLSALRIIDLAIAGSLDLRLSLSAILEQILTRLEVDAAAVLLLDPVTQRLVHAASRGFQHEAITRTRLRIDEGLAGEVMLNRTMLAVHDLAAEQYERADLWVQEGFTSYVAAPLVSSGQVLGILELYHRTRLDPDQHWHDFFAALTGQAAIAVSHATLFEQVQRTNTDLRLAYDATIEGWSRALDLRDHETEGHSERVTEQTVVLGRHLGLSNDDLIQLRRGALLHDIGKLGVPDAILHKPGPLTEEEWAVMRQHPQHAFNLLSPVKYLRPALHIPYSHHEKWDGSGYPQGLRDVHIPIEARIFAVVDVWDALRSDRPYRSAWPEDRVRQHIAAASGAHFDPEVVRAFLELEQPAGSN